ncbi:MAG: alkaline phosphatase family protein [Paludibaculum sp.]
MRNVTASPSLTAVSHIAIATGSNSVHNDIPSNTYHNVAATIAAASRALLAPIGGYKREPARAVTATRPAQPLWVKLRQQGKSVVTATWPGADGADIKINKTVVSRRSRPASPTTTVPFGAFGGLSATGFVLTASQFSADPAVAAQLSAVGHFSHSPVLATAPFETFTCSSGTTATCTTAATLDLKFEMRAAALDTTNDGVVNYDTLVIFEKTQGITAGPFHAPSTGPAYIKLGGESGPFFFEGTGNKVGASYFVSAMSPTSRPCTCALRLQLHSAQRAGDRRCR